MRHGKRRHKLGASGPHRTALIANLSVALITHGRIKTTLAKAKALRPFVEKAITLAKKAETTSDTARKLHFRRLAIARLRDESAVKMLFDERVREFMERPGGYTRIYKLGQRIGDAAEMALIELIDANDEGYAKRPAKKATGKANPEKAEADKKDEPVTEEAEAVAADSDAADNETEDEATSEETEASATEPSASEEEAAEETVSEEEVETSDEEDDEESADKTKKDS